MRNFDVTVQIGGRSFAFHYSAKDVCAAIDGLWETYPEADLIQVDPL
jgi:hypothetical protein